MPHQRVIFTTHEMKHPGRAAVPCRGAVSSRHQAGAADWPVAEHGQPSIGQGAALFTFFARTAESERRYVREKSLGGQAARERGRRGGRPTCWMTIAYARSLPEPGLAVPYVAGLTSPVW